MEGTRCPKSPSYHEDVLQRAVLTAINGMIGRIEEVDSSAEENSKRMTAEVSSMESHIKEINEKLADIETERAHSSI